jgi:hypothetical protein
MVDLRPPEPPLRDESKMDRSLTIAGCPVFYIVPRRGSGVLASMASKRMVLHEQSPTENLYLFMGMEHFVEILHAIL